MIQQDFFTAVSSGNKVLSVLTSAKSLKQHGQESVMRNEKQEWKERMEDVIYAVAKKMETFTMDDIRSLANTWKIEPPTHCNSFGAIMKTAASHHWAVMTGEYVPSKNVKARGRMQAKWRSLIYEK